MAIFKTVDVVADFDATVGLVEDFVWSGYEDGASVRAQGQTGTLGYGRCDLTEGKTDLYVRAYFALTRSTVASRDTATQPEPHIIRGRDNGDANDCFTFRPIWDATHKHMVQGVRLTVHHNSDSVDYDLEHPMPSAGIFWIEFRVTTGATYGTVQAWLAGEEVLAETRIIPNDNRAARYVDFGVTGNTVDPADGWDQLNMDKIILADEYSGPPAFSPSVEETHSQHGRTYTVYKVVNSPVGGWQDLLPGVSDYIVEKLSFHPGCVGLCDFRDKNGKVLWRSPQGWDKEQGARQHFKGKGHALQHARQIRCNAAPCPMHIECCVRT